MRWSPKLERYIATILEDFIQRTKGDDEVIKAREIRAQLMKRTSQPITAPEMIEKVYALRRKLQKKLNLATPPPHINRTVAKQILEFCELGESFKNKLKKTLSVKREDSQDMDQSYSDPLNSTMEQEETTEDKNQRWDLEDSEATPPLSPVIQESSGPAAGSGEIPPDFFANLHRMRQEYFQTEGETFLKINQNLREAHDKMRSEIAELKKENSGFKRQLSEVKKKNSELQRKNTELATENQTLRLEMKEKIKAENDSKRRQEHDSDIQQTSPDAVPSVAPQSEDLQTRTSDLPEEKRESISFVKQERVSMDSQ